MNEKIIEKAGKIISERACGPQNFCTLVFVDWQDVKGDL